jgi:hypothetical protein
MSYATFLMRNPLKYTNIASIVPNAKHFFVAALGDREVRRFVVESLRELITEPLRKKEPED